MDGQPQVAPPEGGGAGAHEGRLALLNAVKLSLSLIGTIAVAMVVRVFVPRFLGVERFGSLSFADAYAATFFTFATFGVDTYIRKEVSTRPEHAADFYAGFMVVRLAASAVILALLMPLGLIGKTQTEWQLAYIFAVGQVAFIDNYTLSAFLQSASRVNELAWMNVGSKLLWCGSIFVGLLAGLPVHWVAICFALSEAVKTLYLMRVTHRHLQLHWRVDMAATYAVLLASLPYFLNNIALRIYEKLNILLLKNLATNHEVGWYTAAVSIAGFSLLFLPVLQAVVMPLASRSSQTSTEAMNEVMRGAARLMVVGGTLIALVLALNAETIALAAFGSAFAESRLSLQVLAPMFPLTYLATVGSLHLIQQGRTWTLIKISLLAMLLNPALAAPLILYGGTLGPGMAGAMSALATVVTEAVTVSVNLYIVGGDLVDRRFGATVARTLLIVAAVSGAHYALPGLGPWRIVTGGLLYLALALALKTLPVDELRRMMGEARRSRAARR